MSSKQLVCTQCGYVGKPQGAIKGNGFIEIILWLFLIVPGLIYSIWRSSSRYKICPKCKGTSLIPVDSPRAHKIMSESMTQEEVLKIEENSTNSSDFNIFKIAVKYPKYFGWLTWVEKHLFLSFVILIFGLPILLGIISGIVGPTESKSKPEVVAPVVNSRPIPTLTERLKKSNNDPYWTSTTQSDYSDNIKIQATSIIFSTYANEVAEGQKSSSDEDKELTLELKKKLVAKQVQEFPKMRKAYAQFAKKLLWEQDIDVTSSGTTLTLVGAIFASNKGISAVEGNIEEMLKELRFKRVNYKWIQHEQDYMHFDLDTPNDSELIPVSI